MLNNHKPTAGINKRASRQGQRGMVLIIVLIVLTAMMFAGIALMRSVDTTTLVAGNMAFRQAATHLGDIGTEAAVEWLQANSGSTSTTLQSDQPHGYFASVVNPSTSWDIFWTTLDKTPVTYPVSTAGGVLSGSVWTLASTINKSYTVSYVIHRMCQTAGPTSTSNCAFSPVSSGTSTGNSTNVGSYAFSGLTQPYYRITSRIVGPHNTVSYTQAMVAM